MIKTEAPSLAQYRNLSKYTPRHGDIVLWAGWFTIWTGLVSSFDKDKQELSIIFGGLPVALLMMSDAEQQRNTRVIPFNRLFKGLTGTWTIIQHELESNAVVWYI